jgi:hypothetical protein
VRGSGGQRGSPFIGDWRGSGRGDGVEDKQRQWRWTARRLAAGREQVGGVVPQGDGRAPLCRAARRQGQGMGRLRRRCCRRLGDAQNGQGVKGGRGASTAIKGRRRLASVAGGDHGQVMPGSGIRRL